MKNKVLYYLIKKSKFSLTLSFVFLIQLGTAQTCESVACPDPTFPPTSVDGITVTASFTGDVITYPNGYYSCIDSFYYTPPNAPLLGPTASFNYTLNFSVPMNDLCIILTATGAPIAETFIINTDTGIPDVYDQGSCFSSVAGNTITTGTGADVEVFVCDDALGGAGGGIFKISNPTSDYSSITISGPGGSAGSLFSICGICSNEPPEIIHTDINCSGECTGTASVIEGSSPPYTYLWDDMAGATTTPTVEDLCEGTYTVLVTDGLGIEETLEVTIEAPPLLGVNILSITDVLCYEESTGSVILEAYGGTPPYTYDIGDGPVSEGTFTDLAAGHYTAQIIDQNDCDTSIDFTINAPPPILVNEITNNETCEGDCNGAIYLDASGGVGDFTFSINDCLTTDIVGEYLDLCPNDYYTCIIDANGCTYNSAITVYPGIPIEANFDFSPMITTIQNTEINFTDLSIEATSWNWIFEDDGISNIQDPTFIFPEIEGEYEITLYVKNDSGCVDSLTKQLIINPEHLIYVPNVFTPDGDQFNNTFSPQISGIDVQDYHLSIYNRWGEILFESFDANTGWEGTYGGNLVQDGVYIWQIDFGVLTSDKRYHYNGHVTIIK